MSRYSFPRVALHAFSSHRRWRPTIRAAEPRASYDVIIVGGGGQGLATAYFLAKLHGIRRVAVLERSVIGHGISGHNTQVTRSDYYHLANAKFYDRSLKLYKGLSRELNYDLMLSRRDKITLAHSPHELEILRRTANAILMNGVDAEMLSVDELHRLVPALNRRTRFPIAGAAVQRRGGICHHDAVVWAFARAANQLGVDIIQDCEVIAFRKQGDTVTGVETTQGAISAPRICLSVASHSSDLARKAGLGLPLASMALQAMVTEPVKHLLAQVLMSATIHVYLSQSERGEIVIGGAADGYTSYAQRAGLPVMEANAQASVELFPCLSRLRIMCQWGVQ